MNDADLEIPRQCFKKDWNFEPLWIEKGTLTINYIELIGVKNETSKEIPCCRLMLLYQTEYYWIEIKILSVLLL